ncbi:hypothetical protein OS493_036644 [Desmophyllum pertusum]|uniref:Transmembrane protein n=1 Tax=Desmophyllum pertusum TaxID=174260 RepID=A0A9W9YUJ9_9CNID|nr:hypothetical protein OS493_036644 [Desmophyllum pertusum]
MEVNSDNSDKKGLLDGRPAYTPPYSPTNEFDNALFHEKGRSPKEKVIMFLFISFVTAMVMITIILSLYRGSVVDSTYILLGVSIISIGLVELVLVYWSRTGELPTEKLWFLYFVGICIMLESVLTNVLLYHRPKV